MSGTLYVVATPIGNLEDITLRALRVLRDVPLIAAEDTRRTAGLLAHHGISTPTISFHAHNAHSRIPQLVDKLCHGMSIALVTDAGTPGVSDPGTELVAAAVNAGVAIDPVPGASASLTAAVASGFPLQPLTIMGFAPVKAKDRKAFLAAIAVTAGTVTFFEAPHRIAATLAEMASVFGERPIMIGRELTKIHQEFHRGSADQLLTGLGEPRGEFTVVVAPAQKAPQIIDFPDDSHVLTEFCELTNSDGAGRRDAVTALAHKYGKPAREVYAAIERAKKIG